MKLKDKVAIVAGRARHRRGGVPRLVRRRLRHGVALNVDGGNWMS